MIADFGNFCWWTARGTNCQAVGARGYNTSMIAKRELHGIVAAFTLAGGVIMPLLPWRIDPEIGSKGARQRVWESIVTKSVLGGALTGFACGIPIDLVINGLPRREKWKINRRAAVLAVVALIVAANASLSLWKIWHLSPPNY
jgi:hypothetical protein